MIPISLGDTREARGGRELEAKNSVTNQFSIVGKYFRIMTTINGKLLETQPALFTLRN